MKNVLVMLALCAGLCAFSEAPTVSFTLRNGSIQSIPLIIPNVMNPNLSPLSNSGVTLEVGQEIWFVVDGEPKLLLEVTAYLEGQTILVHQLIKKRRKVLQQEAKGDY